MDYLDLINLYKKESSDVVNNLSSDDLLKFINLVINAYESEKKIFCWKKATKVVPLINRKIFRDSRGGCDKKV